MEAMYLMCNHFSVHPLKIIWDTYTHTHKQDYFRHGNEPFYKMNRIFLCLYVCLVRPMTVLDGWHRRQSLDLEGRAQKWRLDFRPQIEEVQETCFTISLGWHDSPLDKVVVLLSLQRSFQVTSHYFIFSEIAFLDFTSLASFWLIRKVQKHVWNKISALIDD